MNILFVWYNSFFPNNYTTNSCIQFEKASVLYNIASVYSQLAANERLSSHDGKKNAAMLFQKAAGVLNYIRDTYCQKLGVKVESNSDLDENNLSAMATLMLAQAAECYYEKATEG